MKQILFSFFLSILSLTSFAQQTVYDVIFNSNDHDTLEAAVVAAGLVETLSDTNATFTVFAPTDGAFANLPAGTIETVLADSTLLSNILLYHVVADSVMSTDLTNGMTITTLQGQNVTVTIDTNGVFINNAMVTVADIVTDNGVVHVIDAVLLPQSPETNTILDIVSNSADHDTLEAAVIAAGLAETLSGSGPFTLFAPTDAAFANLPDGTLQALLDSIPELTNILLYHVTPGTFMSTDLTNGQQLPTMTFYPPLTVTIDTNGVMINEASVIVADIVADNGVVHVIDAVLSLDIINSVSQVDNFDITFQNPVNSNIEFIVPNTRITNVQILSLSGQVVMNHNFNSNSVSINTDNLLNGLYLMRVSGDNLNGVCKFVK